MFKSIPFIKLNFGFVCVRVGVQRVYTTRFTVSKKQPLFTSISPFFIALMTKMMTIMTEIMTGNELLNWFFSLVLG